MAQELSSITQGVGFGGSFIRNSDLLRSQGNATGQAPASSMAPIEDGINARFMHNMTN
jgi:hypothetical protein